MATLVLSTVGNALGGPVGGAIGSLLGQGIDQQLFGSGPRHGPRLGDLAVQTSSYGTPIPRLFGTMRVAGSVVWATDLVESGETQVAKGQPETITYSYSVSLAVALSCRRTTQVKRIWADGKLIRGAAGDFKVGTQFRFYPGGEDQPVDPLIASVEGIGSTPAFRGLALAVFEDLQLAEFGNRIPFLTFEVEADAAVPTIAQVLRDTSGGIIECTSVEAIPGYAAHGDRADEAVEPLIRHFGVDLVDDGEKLRSAPLRVEGPSVDDLGCGTDRAAPAKERARTAASTMPSVLALSYYDPQRDYQTGQLRASVDAPVQRIVSERLPVVLSAAAAKALAEESLARRWSQRERLTLRLPPAYLALGPGSLLRVPGEAGLWSVVRQSIEGSAVVVQLRPQHDSVAGIVADPGRVVTSPDVVAQPTVIALIELPDVDASAVNAPVIVLAATSSAAVWRSVPVEIKTAGGVRTIATRYRATVLGHSATALAGGQSALLDMQSSVDVQLVHPDQWLQSCDDEALANGANIAVLGNELIQFGSAVPLGAQRFRLSRLLRGRRGTEWAMTGHLAGESFVVLDSARLLPVEVGADQIGGTITATARGLADDGAGVAELIVLGEALRPPAPVHVVAQPDADGSISLSWVRRSRGGFAWTDGVDAPVGAAQERYRVRLEGSLSVLEAESVFSSIAFTAEQVSDLGGGAMTFSVVQVGDLAPSRPASVEIP